MRQIIITFDNDKGFAVTEAGRTADRLGWDEMLGQVAQLTHPKIGIPHYKMQTVEEYNAHEDKYNVPAGERLQFDERGIPR
jgi:hypothetical protein